MRDARRSLTKVGGDVVGISPDMPGAQRRFDEKYSLGFPLLSDPDRAVASRYGAYGEKVLYGKKSMGIIRSTVIIGKDGKVAKVFPKVKVAGHDQAVLDALKAL